MNGTTSNRLCVGYSSCMLKLRCVSILNSNYSNQTILIASLSLLVRVSDTQKDRPTTGLAAISSSHHIDLLRVTADRECSAVCGTVSLVR